MSEEKESEEQYYSEEEWGDILFEKEMAIRDIAEKTLDIDQKFGIILMLVMRNNLLLNEAL